MKMKFGISISFDEVESFKKQGVEAFNNKLNELGFDTKKPIDVEKNVTTKLYTFTQMKENPWGI